MTFWDYMHAHPYLGTFLVVVALAALVTVVDSIGTDIVRARMAGRKDGDT